MTATSPDPNGAPAGVPLRCDAAVVSNAPLGAENHRMTLRIDGWPGAAPGQFVMISPGPLGAAERFDPLLPRPMAVYRERAASGATEVEILYKASGRGTRLLTSARAGDKIRLVGPLGRGFPLPGPSQASPHSGPEHSGPEAGAGAKEGSKVGAGPVEAILVGGGTGIASLYTLAESALRAGGGGAPPRVRVQLGARSREDLMGHDDFAELGVSLEIATEDGSLGERGLVTELLERALGEAADGGAHVYACGPTPMMRRCAEIAAAHSAPCHVSLENGMACGFGVCLGCAAPRTSGGYALVCREGPVFEASAVRWEGLP